MVVSFELGFYLDKVAVFQCALADPLARHWEVQACAFLNLLRETQLSFALLKFRRDPIYPFEHEPVLIQGLQLHFIQHFLWEMVQSKLCRDSPSQ